MVKQFINVPLAKAVAEQLNYENGCVGALFQIVVLSASGGQNQLEGMKISFISDTKLWLPLRTSIDHPKCDPG